jgi:hypothetical protein
MVDTRKLALVKVSRSRIEHDEFVEGSMPENDAPLVERFDKPDEGIQVAGSVGKLFENFQEGGSW